MTYMCYVKFCSITVYDSIRIFKKHESRPLKYVTGINSTNFQHIRKFPTKPFLNFELVEYCKTTLFSCYRTKLFNDV